MTEQTLIYILASGLILLSFGFLIVWMKMRRKGELVQLELRQKVKEAEDFAGQVKGLEKRLEEAISHEHHLEKEGALLRNELKNLQNRYSEFKSDTEMLQQRFENLANRIIDEKTAKFDKEHREGLKGILDPLKEQIKFFEEKIEKSNLESVSRHTSLKEQISTLKDLNDRMTQETHNLTKALKSDSKTQGSWGEFLLESILEKSGLQKGREYSTQKPYKNEEGARIQPDVVIHLPGKRDLVIDAKVSLTAYEKFISGDSEKERVSALKAHILSIRNHVRGLSSKKYHQIYDISSPEFVLMFIPIESAFSATLSEEPGLYKEAFDKNIVIVTPTTLLATLKTVDSLWQNEKQKKNVLEIANQAGRMYDKFILLLDSMDKIGLRIDQAKLSYEEATRRIKTGSGNLLTRASKLKALGAKASKQIPERWLESADEEE